MSASFLGHLLQTGTSSDLRRLFRDRRFLDHPIDPATVSTRFLLLFDDIKDRTAKAQRPNIPTPCRLLIRLLTRSAQRLQLLRMQ